MKIDFESLTDHDLADLIMGAAEEWKLRQRQDHKTVVRRNPALQPKVVAIDEPPENEKRFVLHIKAKAAGGELIVASERRGVAAIAEKYPDWVKRQELPTEGGASAWRNLKNKFRTGVAKEL